MRPDKATHQQTKIHNRDLVLKTIFDHETISRAEVARLTKLTRATVSDIVANLINEGLVEEVGYGSSIGGKSPILLSLVADSRYLIGLNLAQDKFIGAVVNLRGELKEQVEFPVHDRNGQQALQLIYQILDRLTASPWKPLVGIGIGTPGLVNTRDGIVVNAVNLDWQELPLAKLLETRYGLPVSVLNDSQATAIGEYVYGGDHRGDSNLIVVNVRHGIGAGILINGRLFQGDGGGAGEIGHVVVRENGRLCRCGKHGCLETIASARAVVQRFQEIFQPAQSKTPPDETPETSLAQVKAAFALGNPQAQQVVREAGAALGTSLGSLIGALNIEKIVLTGDMAGFGEPWLEAVRQAMYESALSRMARNTRLEVGTLEYRACILGASAYMLLDNYSLLFHQPSD
jgi:predicted NBD/HSP70 family sugar kinase